MANPSNANRSVATKELVDDLKFFAKRAKEGRVISREGLVEFINKKHNDCHRGRSMLWNIAKQNGIEPWWKK